jgi:hypothetical protein
VILNQFLCDFEINNKKEVKEMLSESESVLHLVADPFSQAVLRSLLERQETSIKIRCTLQEAAENLRKNGTYVLRLKGKDDVCRAITSHATQLLKIANEADDTHLRDDAYLLEAMAQEPEITLR